MRLRHSFSRHGMIKHRSSCSQDKLTFAVGNLQIPGGEGCCPSITVLVSWHLRPEYESLALLQTPTHPLSVWSENFYTARPTISSSILAFEEEIPVGSRIIFRFQPFVFSCFHRCIPLPRVQDVMADKVVVGCWACGKQGVQVSGFDDGDPMKK